jgi:hypothetical protein
LGRAGNDRNLLQKAASPIISCERPQIDEITVRRKSQPTITQRRRRHYLDRAAGSLAQIPDGAAKTNGIAVGEFVAAEMVALRSADGSAPVPYTLPPPGVGIWRPTSPAPPAFPWWGGVTPFVLESATQFHVAGPPALTSAEYAADVNESKLYGGTTSALRTPEQTEGARFWFESTTLSWNRIARALAAERQTSVAENARLFALLNMSLSDAVVVVFETKYRFNFWRPIHASASTTAPRSTTTATPTPCPTQLGRRSSPRLRTRNTSPAIASRVRRRLRC